MLPSKHYSHANECDCANGNGNGKEMDDGDDDQQKRKLKKEKKGGRCFVSEKEVSVFQSLTFTDSSALVTHCQIKLVLK